VSLSTEQLRSALEAVHYVHSGLWEAQNFTQLERAAADAMTTVWLWSMPGPTPWGPEYSHARGSLVAYVLGSTYRLRRAELVAVGLPR
jgi:hypothetical protein